jgi:hypothetical protein
MGGLIQTKGTQRLANFLNNQRFDANSINKTRNLENNIGGLKVLLKNAFASALDKTPLLTISDAFIAQNAGASWFANGKDALYPSTTLVAAATPATDKVTFINPVPGWPNSIPPGVASPKITAANLEQGKGPAIPKDTTILAVDPVAGTNRTTVTFSNNVPGCVAGDRISFSHLNHKNLVRRWRHYLAFDLTPSNHSRIQSAVLSALFDTSVSYVAFQTIEDIAQTVLVNTEYPATSDGEESNLDITKKYISLALITPRTSAPDPLDPQ